MAEKLLIAKALHLENFNSPYHTVAKLLDVMLKGSAHDIFAADVFYHNRCLQNISRLSKRSEKDPMIDLVLHHIETILRIYLIG